MLPILNSGTHEPFKAVYHGCLAVLVGGAAIYNSAAFVLRREPHLACNAVLYAALTALEVSHVQHHRSATV